MLGNWFKMINNIKKDLQYLKPNDINVSRLFKNESRQNKAIISNINLLVFFHEKMYLGLNCSLFDKLLYDM